MTALKPVKVSASLQKKGFLEDKGHDHIQYTLYYRGEKTRISTKMSHNSDDISGKLLKRMAFQMKLESQEFVDFVKCTLSEDDYVGILIGKGLLDSSDQGMEEE